MASHDRLDSAEPGLCYAIQLLSSGLVGENSADSKVFPESANSSISHPVNGKWLLFQTSQQSCSITRQTEVLNLDASFLGTARVVGWLGLMLGTFTYNRYLKTMKLRTILLWAYIGLSLLTLLDIILVSRVNLACRISDKILVISGSALADAINQFKCVHVFLIP
ncbi:hypothetical protein NC653_004314 [Populus alba x Populus x berolinensis]|uniref:Uncharacterized protein n=1 Tax=Populus alba x Populus x berolinensis TaxID=444605 RepID=A0AAD6RUJ1_9ROSI|nr:hypothetical protein NC653_004314 [Populus alba x Populus x berolinensis]